MTIGPFQSIVLGFEHPEFHGEIVAELERLMSTPPLTREGGTVFGSRRVARRTARRVARRR